MPLQTNPFRIPTLTSAEQLASKARGLWCSMARRSLGVHQDCRSIVARRGHVCKVSARSGPDASSGRLQLMRLSPLHMQFITSPVRSLVVVANHRYYTADLENAILSCSRFCFLCEPRWSRLVLNVQCTFPKGVQTAPFLHE